METFIRLGYYTFWIFLVVKYGLPWLSANLWDKGEDRYSYRKSGKGE